MSTQPVKPYPEDWPQPKPYIGVTGFNTVQQVKRIAEHVDSYPVGYVMFGITSSNKRLLDPDSRGKTSPALVDIPSLRQFIPQHHLPMIHYYTSNLSTLVDEVVALWGYCELEDVGLQLNVDASPKQIAAILEKLNHTCSPNFNNGVLPITAQISRKILSDMDNAQIINSLRRYEGLLSYALIDPSGGEGRDVDLYRASELLIAGQDLEFLLGIAGGFSDENVEERVKRLRQSAICESCHQDLPRSFCIDAQGKLADIDMTAPVYPPDGPSIIKSHLNLSRTKTYIDQAITALYS